MKQIIHTDNAPAAIGPYVQAQKIGDFIFTSGQLGIDVAKGGMGQILAKAGADYANIIKTTIFVKDLADFATVNQVYASYFQGDYPARSCVQVAALPMGGLVEIEAIAKL